MGKVETGWSGKAGKALEAVAPPTGREGHGSSLESRSQTPGPRGGAVGRRWLLWDLGRSVQSRGAEGPPKRVSCSLPCLVVKGIIGDSLSPDNDIWDALVGTHCG